MRRNLIHLNPDNVITVSPRNADFTLIQDAINKASSGNLIVVYPGTYNEQITLKAGVDFHFIGNVIISSDSSQGTVIDNNIQIVSNWSGTPVITNSNGLNKRIVLQNSLSKINGFCWKYTCLLGCESEEDNPVAKVLENSIGSDIVWTRTVSQNEYIGTLANAFATNKTHALVTIPYQSTAEFVAWLNAADINTLMLQVYTNSATDVLSFSKIFLEIKIYP